MFNNGQRSGDGKQNKFDADTGRENKVININFHDEC